MRSESQRSTPFLYLACSSIPALLLILGLSRNQEVLLGSWSKTGGQIPLLVFGGIFAGVSLVSVLLKWQWILRLIWMLPLLLIVAVAGFEAFASVSLLLVAGYAVGARTMVQPEESLEGTVLRILLGLGILVFFVSLLVHFPINSTIAYRIALLIILFLLRRTLPGLFASLRFSARALAPSNGSESLLMSLLMLVLSVHTVQVLRPEMMFDALAIHLNIPAFVAAHGEWSFDVNQFVFAVMPMGGDWMYTIAYLLGGESAARLTNFSFLLLITGILFDCVKTQSNRNIALISCILFLSSPLVFVETGSLFVDNIWAAYLLGGLLYLWRYASRGQHTLDLLCSGCIFGVALSTKVTSVFFVAPAVLGVFLLCRTSLRSLSFWTQIFSTGLVFAAIGLPTYVYAYIATHNPVFPFYNAYFKSPYYDSTRNFTQPTFTQSLTWRSLYDMSFHGGRFLEAGKATLGFQFLAFSLIVLATLALRGRPQALFFAFVAGAFFLLVFPFQAYLRYLYPAFVLGSILIGWAFVEVSKQGPMVICLNGIVISIVLLLNLWNAPAGLWVYQTFPIREMLQGKINEEQNIFVPQRKLIDLINRTYGDRTTVLFLSEPYTVGLEGTALVDVWYNDAVARALQRAVTVEDIATVMKRWQVTHVIHGNSLGRNAAMKDFLAQHAKVEFSQGNGKAHKIDPTTFPRIELLKNGTFDGGIDPWGQVGEVKRNVELGGVEVSNENFLSQLVAVAPKTQYVLELEAKSLEQGGEIRLQVNWMSETGILETSLHVEQCNNNFATFTRVLQAPEKAVSAVVFVIAHSTNTPIVVKRISFAQ